MRSTIAIFVALLTGTVVPVWSQDAAMGTSQNQGNNIYQNNAPSNTVGPVGNAMFPATRLVTRGTNDLAPGNNTNQWIGTNHWFGTNLPNGNGLGGSSTNAAFRKH